ncbi:MAG TPA: condensation domain-containing protein, partial [Candidatus Limnocylindria bacterium]|nr:condensation domain-containing protein [Candidatus Limnocylindria bacterium]
VKLTPSHLEGLGALLSAQGAGSARRLVVGGEALSGEMLRLWREQAPWVEVINEYGPTETVVGCCVHRLAAGEAGSGAVPIGRPIGNTELYVLDGEGRAVPVGVRGELYIGGAGVARGYLGRAGLTASRFVPNPYGSAGSRLYRTGDVVRWRREGVLEYLGRNDAQVKVRGQRIELGEIEAQLRAHAGVGEAVVVLRRDEGQGRDRLVAYVTGRDGAAPSAGELRAHLSRQLPEAMLPSAYVGLAALPLTVNGKVDRQALPAPRREVSVPGSAPAVAPRRAEEELLAAIWADLLGLDTVSINDSFFELGGDSIVAIQAVARANAAGLQLTPIQLFRHQTIAELAQVVTLGQPDLVSLPEVDLGSPAPLTPIQRWFFEQDWQDAHHYNQSLLFRLPVGIGPDQARTLLGHIWRQHDALRTVFERLEGDWRQTVLAPEPEPDLEFVELASVPAEQRAQTIEATATVLQAGLSLGGPLLRAAFMDFGPGNDGRLLIVVHHLVMDAVSWRILIEDLNAAAERLIERQPLEAARKTTSYLGWATRLAAAASDIAARERNYWSSDRWAEVPALPVDHRIGTNDVASAEVVSHRLSVEETRSLLQDAPKAYRTQINDILLTALGEALARWSGSRRQLIAMEGHGREPLFPDVDLSRTVGWFTSLYPVLLDLPTYEPGSSLKAVKEQLRHIPGRGIGYGILRYLAADDATGAKLAAFPQPAVIFNYVGQFDQVLQEDRGLSLASEPIGPQQSPRAPRPFVLEVTGVVVAGRLQLDIRYSRNLHRRETVAGLLDVISSVLRELVDHCQSDQAGGY